MSIKKQYLKKNNVCKITFSLNDNIGKIESIRILGDFNNWDKTCDPMKKLIKGGSSQTINLDTGKAYQFKYLINDSIWANDPESDQFVPNGFGNGDTNSLIVL